MTDNIAKREQARQVWRLNKKEDIPVLEALQTANISKDTYYEYKREYESDWENQLLTVQEVEERLDELSDQLSDMRELADTVEDQVEDVGGDTELIEKAEEAHSTAIQCQQSYSNIKLRMDKLEEEIGYSYDPEKDSPPKKVSEVSGQVAELKSQVEDMQDRVSGFDTRLGNLESAHQSDVSKLWEDVHRAANSGLLASDNVLQHNL